MRVPSLRLASFLTISGPDALELSPHVLCCELFSPRSVLCTFYSMPVMCVHPVLLLCLYVLTLHVYLTLPDATYLHP
jgi:hypothetical protein